ncbi:MAG: 3-dehydroquinate synthase family protein [Actinomycetota bacterium]
MGELNRVRVDLADRAYDVLVGSGAIESLPDLVPTGVKRIVVVSQRGIPMADTTVVIAQRSTPVVHRVDIGEGELAKSLATIEELCEFFASVGLTRQDLVVGVGGGLVTDVAGFAASVWHRGTRVVHVSTTLLGMVDAAIGGKTGVNLSQGKNLVGAFWQPSGVVCDLDALATLPDRETRCGLGEISKYHFLTGEDLLALDLGERIARCVRIKADIVAADEREGGARALLNYGHTLAHAIETVGGHKLAHGEAVAVGIGFAAQLAHDLGRIDHRRVEEHRRVVAGTYGLDMRPPRGLELDALMETMARDKKAVDGLTFILDSSRGLEVVADVDPVVVRRTLASYLLG